MRDASCTSRGQLADALARLVAAIGWIGGWMFLILGSGTALAAEPTAEPLLRLETGMHVAVITRIATDAVGRWAVTASDDKTARVWEVTTGRQVAVLRPPQDVGDEGKLYAVAISPDGKFVAVAGWTGWDWNRQVSIYLFDRASNRLVRRIPGLPTVVHHLDWSPDGRWLAASLRGRNGIRLFDAATGVERGRDADYGGQSNSVRFSSDSRRLVSTSLDGQVRVHAIEGQGGLRLLKAARTTGGERPYSAGFSPDGGRIAVGFYNSRVVQVLDAQSLAEVARPVTTGVNNGDLGNVAWSADGRSLLAGGRWSVAGKSLVRRWAVDDWSRYQDVPVAKNTVLDLVPLPAAAGGGWLFATFDPGWGVLDAAGQVLRRQGEAIADFRDQLSQLQVSADSRRVRFGYLQGGAEPRIFDAAARALEADVAARAAGVPLLRAARTSAPGLDITDWENRTDPKLNGKPPALEPYEISRSLAIASDGRRFVLGTDWNLRLFDSTGKELWPRPVSGPGVVWAVNISADDRFVIAAYSDGTIRWHRLEDGREILAFFPHADRKRWVAWTPEGYFDASPGAEDLIGYHLNRGQDREGEFVSARQLWETFYQPALIARRLDPEGDRLLAEQVQRRGDVGSLLAAGSVPELVLESPAEVQTEGSYLLKVRIRNAGQGRGRLVVRVDGVELQGRAGWNAPALTPGSVVTIPVDPAPGSRKVTAELVDERGVASRAVAAQVNVTRRPSTGGGTLHVLAVGVTNYRDHALASGVAFAAGDARAVGTAFDRGSRGLYAQVRLRVLPDGEATREGIEAAGRALEADVKPDDTVVIYLAGHGMTVDGDYHFVPWETRYTNFDALKAQSLSADRLRRMLAAITARKVLVLLDTCSAGGFSLVKGGRAMDDKASIDRFQRVTGRAVIAATADEKMALEGEGQHGVFTFALLNALEGAADRDRDGFVSVSEVAEYIDEQVPAITKRKWGYEQFPMMETRGSVFPLVRRAQ